MLLPPDRACAERFPASFTMRLCLAKDIGFWRRFNMN